MWYHDHAVGITRLNAYAGIASAMLIRDRFETFLKNLGLPEFIEVSVLAGQPPRELPIVIQDKIFIKDANILTDDPTWTGATSSGSLWYAHTYEPDRWDLLSPPGPPQDPSSIPEFFGDTMLVNGTVYPQVNVEARRYRLRLLNACNARFLNLQLYEADNSPEGITLDPTTGKPTNKAFVNAATLRPTWLQIGTEGGFLISPAQLPSNVPLSFALGNPDPVTGQTDPSKVFKSLLVAPAERPDVIVDFRLYAGKKVILYSDAPAPFPGGDPVNDYFPGLNNGNAQNTNHFGTGPNTRVLMRFNVGPAQAPLDRPLFINQFTPTFLDIDPLLRLFLSTTAPI
jgi:spore coat protein A